jgi:hypothetical protein
MKKTENESKQKFFAFHLIAWMFSGRKMCVCVKCRLAVYEVDKFDYVVDIRLELNMICVREHTQKMGHVEDG